MRRTFSFALALGLAACSPQQPERVDAPAEAVAAKRMPLPDCGSVAPSPDDGRIPDCRIQSTDKIGLAFEARRSVNADGATKAAIAVVAPGDATAQTIEEEIDESVMPPHLEDLDADGRDELMIPLMTGNANTHYAIWRATALSTNFLRLGELSGVSFGRTKDGAVYAASRSSAAEWVVEYHRINGETLNALARAVVTAEPDADGKLETSCVAEDAGAMTALGLTPETLQQRYCEDPAAAGIFE